MKQFLFLLPSYQVAVGRKNFEGKKKIEMQVFF